MRRFGVVLLILVMALSFIGCSSRQTAEADDTLVVGMECAYAPFNWLSNEESETSVALENGGYCDGYDVMIAQRIADGLNKELIVRQISWDALIPSLQNGDIDMIIAGMTADEDREEVADFTSPYYESADMVMIVRKDSPQAAYTDIQDFSGERVVGQSGTNYDTVIDQIEGVEHMTPRDNYAEMVVALQNGDVDGITAELAVAEGVVSANSDLSYLSFEEGHGFEIDTTVSVALREGERGSELFENVESILNSISLAERAEMMAEATSRQPAGE